MVRRRRGRVGPALDVAQVTRPGPLTKSNEDRERAAEENEKRRLGRVGLQDESCLVFIIGRQGEAVVVIYTRTSRNLFLLQIEFSCIESSAVFVAQQMRSDASHTRER